MENKKFVSTVVLTAMLSTSLPTIALAEEHLEGEAGNNQQITEQIVVAEVEEPVLAPVETPEVPVEEQEPVVGKTLDEEREPLKEEQPTVSDDNGDKMNLLGQPVIIPSDNGPAKLEQAEAPIAKLTAAPTMMMLNASKVDKTANAVQLIESLSSEGLSLSEYKQAVTAARKAYNALKEEEQSQIEEAVLLKLTEAEQCIEAAEKVQKTINGLSVDTITLTAKAEVFQKIEKARADFWNLTEEQQILVDTEKLLAAENAVQTLLEPVLANVQEVSAIPWQAPQTAAREASKDIQGGIEYVGGRYNFEGEYTITENAEGNLVVVLEVFDALGKAQEYGQTPFVMPGDRFNYAVNFVNQSKHTYRYQADSLRIAPVQIASEHSGGIGFDGLTITDKMSRKLSNSAPVNALGIKSYQSMTQEEQFAYLLSYANQALEKDYTSLDQMTTQEIKALLLPSGVISGTSNDEAGSALAYGLFWNRLLAITFNSEVVDVSAQNTSEAGLSVGAYMRGESQTKAAGEAVLAEIFAEMKPGDETALDHLAWTVDGPNTTNVWQGATFAGQISFVLEQTDKPDVPPPTPTPPTPPVDPADPIDPIDPIDPGDPGDYPPAEPTEPSQPAVIPEIQVPLAETPTAPAVEAPVIEVPAEVVMPDAEVPLAAVPVTDNPKTGRAGHGWLLSVLLMAAGALGIECKRKKA